MKERMCMVCRGRFNQDEMYRFYKNKDGEIGLNLEKNKADGRGAYLCKNPECLNKFEKSKALNRSFKTKVDMEIYNKIKLRGEEFGRK